MLLTAVPPELLTEQRILAAVGTVVGEMLLQPEILSAAGGGGETTRKLIACEVLAPVLAVAVKVPE